MPPYVCRRFGVLDAMILVAAIAAGLAAIRGIMPYGFNPLIIFDNDGPVRLQAKMVFSWINSSLPVAAALTVSLVPLRLLRPRPPARRVCREPGFVASVAASSVTLGGLLWSIPAIAATNNTFIDCLSFAFSPFMAPLYAGWAVAGAWALLFWGGRWKPQPHWLDRAGRIAGGFWIGWIAASLVERRLLDL